MKPRKLLLLVGIALISACAVDPVTTPPGANDTLTASSNVSRRPYDPNYVEEGRRVLRGIRLADGGCRVGSSDTLRPGQRLLEWVAEYDSSNCTVTLARGRYVGPDRPSRMASPTLLRVDTTTTTGGVSRGTEVGFPSGRVMAPRQLPLLETSPNCDPQIESAWTAYQWLITEDPLQLDVNWDRLEYEWLSRPSFNCIQSSVMTHSAMSFAATGWQIYSFLTYENTAYNNWAYVQGWVASHHSNLPFCVPYAYTYVSYDENKMRIFPDGQVVFDWYYHWWGDCSSLLHAERHTGVSGN